MVGSKATAPKTLLFRIALGRRSIVRPKLYTARPCEGLRFGYALDQPPRTPPHSGIGLERVSCSAGTRGPSHRPSDGEFEFPDITRRAPSWTANTYSSPRVPAPADCIDRQPLPRCSGEPSHARSAALSAPAVAASAITWAIERWSGKVHGSPGRTSRAAVAFSTTRQPPCAGRPIIALRCRAQEPHAA